MPPRKTRAARLGPRSSSMKDSIEVNPDPPATPSSSGLSSPAYSTASSTPASSTPSSSTPASNQTNSRAASSSLPFHFDVSGIYQIHGDGAVGSREWDEYLPSLGYADAIFGALRGTVSERYSTIKASTARREQYRQLREIQTRALLAVARDNHRDNCSACDSDSDKISKSCPRKNDATLVKHGLTEFNNYFEYYRPEITSKHDVEAPFSRARISDNVEVKAIIRLNHLCPYMGYQPGEYLLLLTRISEVTDKQRAISLRVEAPILFKPEEDLERFDDICPAILQIVVAFLGFKPGATDFVPSTLRAFFEPSKKPHEQWESLVEAWDFKFQKVSCLPEFIRFSVTGARTKLSEAAWLIRRLRGETKLMEDFPKRELLFQMQENLLCRMTETTFDELADQHLKQLGSEALGCLEDGDDDQVLVYYADAWSKDYKNIHSFYKTNSGFPAPAPFDAQRLETFRLAALRIIGNEKDAKAILSQVSRLLAEQGLFLDEDNDDTKATTADDETSQSPPTSGPGQSSEPEIPRKKRGRPKKKEGDPKAPYTKRQKTTPANSQSPTAP
ncbi:hypothetical protein PG994_005525 [Apiospora phragmitis]|uniref:Uncharacterized protein n=1 Tax=Apiospora phragmitis TaxID=2905665 RepID=A0ABR1VCH7_9PEZI